MNLTIKRKILIKPVTITGKDFLGRDSTITFTPHTRPGWWWDTKYHGIVPIDHRIARYKKGRIQLYLPGEAINVWEHFGLRYAGIDSVLARMDHNAWPPYMTAGQYLSFFKGAVLETEEFLPTVFVKEQYGIPPGPPLSSNVCISKNGIFSLNIASQWEDLPSHEDTIGARHVLDPVFMEKVFAAKTQALSRRRVAAVVAHLCGWPHIKNVAWKNDFSTPAEAAYAWWLHAVQDALGELSLASHVALPIGSFSRTKVGHRQMLEGIKVSFPIPA